MADPVVLDSGHSAERICMEVWLQRRNLQCPVTGSRLHLSMLISNINLRRAIRSAARAHGIQRPTAPSEKEAWKAVKVFEKDFANRYGSSTKHHTGHPYSGVSSPARNKHAQGFTAKNSSSHRATKHGQDPTNHDRKGANQVQDCPNHSGDRANPASTQNRVNHNPGHSNPSQRHTNPPQQHANPPISNFESGSEEEYRSQGRNRNKAKNAGDSDWIAKKSGSLGSSNSNNSNNSSSGLMPVSPNPAPSQAGETLYQPSGRVTQSDLNSMVDSLLENLRSTDPDQRDKAISEIRQKTRQGPELRLVLCQSALLTSLLDAAKTSSKSDAASANAAAAIVNMSLEPDNKLKIVRVGSLPWLIQMLRGPDGMDMGQGTEVQEHAAAALFSLAQKDENKYAIGTLGALQPLLNLLQNSLSDNVRMDCAMALYHLSLAQTNRSHLAKIGAVATLLKLLADNTTDAELKSRILLILGNLAASEDGRRNLLESNDMITILTKLLSKANLEDIRERSVAILLQLSQNNLRFQSLVTDANAVPVLCDLLNTGTPRAREKASAILSTFGDSSTRNSPLRSEHNLIPRRFSGNGYGLSRTADGDLLSGENHPRRRNDPRGDISSEF